MITIEMKSLIHQSFCLINKRFNFLGSGRSKVEAKSDAAEKMVRMIFSYAKIEDYDTVCEEQRKKVSLKLNTTILYLYL